MLSVHTIRIEGLIFNASYEAVVVAVTDPVSIYAPAALERIRAASSRLEALPEVRRRRLLAGQPEPAILLAVLPAHRSRRVAR